MRNEALKRFVHRRVMLLRILKNNVKIAPYVPLFYQVQHNKHLYLNSNAPKTLLSNCYHKTIRYLIIHHKEFKNIFFKKIANPTLQFQLFYVTLQHECNFF